MNLPPNMPLEVVLQMILGVAGEDPEGAGAMVADLYDNEVGEYRPLLKAAAPVLATIGSDIGLIISVLIDGINGAGSSPELQASVATMTTLRAEARARTVKAYEAAGFTRAEAMTMTLQDVANAKAMVQQFQQPIADGAKKARTRAPIEERKAA